MGLFDSGTGNEAAEELADKANGSSVTAKRLTTTSGGSLTVDYLNDRPIIYYLTENERPHHIFTNNTKGIIKNGNTIGLDTPYRSTIVLTNDRILFFVGDKEGDKAGALPYEPITGVSHSLGVLKSKLTIECVNDTYEFHISGSYDNSEIKEAASFIKSMADNPLVDDNYPSPKGNIQQIDNLSKLWSQKNTSEEIYLEYADIDCEPQNEFVSKKTVENIDDILEKGEKVHYLSKTTQGIEIISGSKKENLKGGGSKKGWVAATDRRVVCRTPPPLFGIGEGDEISVQYEDISTVNLEDMDIDPLEGDGLMDTLTSMAERRLVLETSSRTYRIDISEIDKSVLREMAKFIRKNSKEGQASVETTPEKSSDDPLEKLYVFSPTTISPLSRKLLLT